MESIHLFTTAYVSLLKSNLTKNYIKYTQKSFDYDESQILRNPLVKTDYPELILPEKGNSHNFENSKIIFEGYKMSPVQATDPRIWTYLTHIVYWDYLRNIAPVEKIVLKEDDTQSLEEKRTNYILSHWFIKKIHPDIFFRNNISLLWWVAYLTHDPDKENPYLLTEEAFTQMDYTRLLAGAQGRNTKFVHALLEFVIENNEIFGEHKQDRVRVLLTKLNFIGGYRIIPNLEKDEMKELFMKYKNELLHI